MVFIKLSQEEGEELFEYLKSLKKQNWWIDKISQDINYIINWHYKITGSHHIHDNLGAEDQLAVMTKDLCCYFKNNIHNKDLYKCGRCRKWKGKEEFMGCKYCKDCRKKANRYNRKYNLKKKSNKE